LRRFSQWIVNIPCPAMSDVSRHQWSKHVVLKFSLATLVGLPLVVASVHPAVVHPAVVYPNLIASVYFVGFGLLLIYALTFPRNGNQNTLISPTTMIHLRTITCTEVAGGTFWKCNHTLPRLGNVWRSSCYGGSIHTDMRVYADDYRI